MVNVLYNMIISNNTNKKYKEVYKFYWELLIDNINFTKKLDIIFTKKIDINIIVKKYIIKYLFKIIYEHN